MNRIPKWLEAAHQEDLERKGNGSGFALLFPRGHVPRAYQHRALTLEALREQSRRMWRDLGLRPFAGTEIEFVVHNRTRDSNWRSVRADIVDSLGGDPATRKIARKFGPRETMMYSLHHFNPHTRGLLMPTPPTNYFDAKDVLELRLIHTGLTQQVRAVDEVAEHLYDAVVNQFGFAFDRHAVAPQVSLSLVDDDENIFDETYPRFDELAPSAAAGVLRAVYDCMPLQLDGLQISKAIESSCSLTQDRGGSVRHAARRLEIRPTGLNRFMEPALLMAVALAGADYGVRSTRDPRRFDPEVLAPVHKTRKISVGEVDPALTWVRVILNGSYVRDGKLVVPDKYIQARSAYVAAALGLPVDKHDQALSKIRYREGEPTSRFVSGLVDFFGRIEVVDDGANTVSLQWPTTNERGYRLVSNDNVEHTIDTSMLARALGTAVTHAGLVSDGYDLGATEPDVEDILEAREKRLARSPVLKQMGPTLHQRVAGDLRSRLTEFRNWQANLDPVLAASYPIDRGRPDVIVERRDARSEPSVPEPSAPARDKGERAQHHRPAPAAVSATRSSRARQLRQDTGSGSAARSRDLAVPEPTTPAPPAREFPQR